MQAMSSLPAEACRGGVGWPALEGPGLMNPPETLLTQTSSPPLSLLLLKGEWEE